MSSFTPSGDRLTQLLNETFLPPKLFSDQRISFGVPTVAVADDYDTVVFADAIPGMGYYGSAEIHYTRVPLANIGDAVTLQSEDQFTLDSIAAQLNGMLDTFLASADFVPVAIPTLEQGQTAPLTLTAADSSLGWKGSVDITLSFDKPQISSVINPKALSTLKSNIPDSGIINGKALMFNVDFTSYRDALIPVQRPYGATYYYGFADYAALAGVCRLIGIPGFPDADVYHPATDHATSSIADSNQSFDRVVTLPIASGSMAPSVLYFHYNVLENR
jgi:hypothetical protein